MRPVPHVSVVALFASLSVLTGCSVFDAARTGPLTALGGANYQGVEGGNVTVIRAAADAGCTNVGAPLPLPPNAVIAAWGISAFGFSNGEDTPRDAAWFLEGTSRFNTAGKLVQTGQCVGDRILVGSDKGLEWIDSKDLTSGTFSSTLFNGNGVSAILPLDSTHVLAGILNNTGASSLGAVVCDLAANTCNQAATPFTNFGFGDKVTFYRFPGGTILAGTRAAGMWRSTNGGLAWTAVNGGLTGIFTSAFVGSGSDVFIPSGGGVYKSTNDGQSWTKMANGLGSGTIFPTALAGDGTTMYTALNSATADVPATLWKTTNGAASWQRVGTGLTAQFVSSLATTSGAVWAATNAGVFRSTDGAASFAPFNKGLDNTNVYRVLAVGGTLYAGVYQGINGVFRSTDNGQTWLPGDAVMNNRSIRALAAVGSTVIASGEVGVFRSTDGGVTWASSRTGLTSNLNPYSLLAVGNTIYAGLFPAGFARSTDAGASWTVLGSGLPGGSTYVTAVAASGGTLVAAAGATVYRSVDGGGSWTPGGPLNSSNTAYLVSTLAFSGTTLFAGLQGFGTPDTHGLFKSVDFGVTWTRSQNGIPSNTPVYDVESSGARLLAGTSAGLWASTDGGATWVDQISTLDSTSVLSVVAAGNTVHAGTFGRGLFSIATPAIARRLLPIVLDVNNGFAHYTTDLALTNRGTTPANLTLLYTASLGSGTGTTIETLAPGQQLLVPDVLAYLRTKGLSMPSGGSQAGTLLVTFDNLSDPEAGYAVARTTAATGAPQPAGAAGLAYVAMDPARGEVTKLRVYGLRSSANDRSNVAVFNTSGVSVTLKITAFSGSGNGASSVVEPGVTLPPWGWTQYNRILDGPGYATGWAIVERTSATGSFGTYGVINDNPTNDGSFIPATTSDVRPAFMNVPVLVETPAFRSELVLTNASSNRVTFTLTFTESLAASAARGVLVGALSAPVQVTIEARTVEIHAEAVDWLRSLGATVGPRGASSYAGSVHIDVAGALINDTNAGARTAAVSPGGGQFGLFSPAFLPGEEGVGEAWLYGLRADANNRANVAVTNTATSAVAGPITVRADVFDGKHPSSSPVLSLDYVLQPGQWKQENDLIFRANIENGYVRLRLVSGAAPFLGYAIGNDGRNPGDRTGDGAYLPIVTRYTF